jgi:hypothetical protein
MSISGMIGTCFGFSSSIVTQLSKKKKKKEHVQMNSGAAHKIEVEHSDHRIDSSHNLNFLNTQIQVRTDWKVLPVIHMQEMDVMKGSMSFIFLSSPTRRVRQNY